MLSRVEFTKLCTQVRGIIETVVQYSLETLDEEYQNLRRPESGGPVGR